MDKFGLAMPLAIQPNGLIIGGHARFRVMMEQGNGNTQIDCYVPDRELTEKEYEELNIRLNKNVAGEWNFDMLANLFDFGDLTEWGFEEKDLGLGEDKEEKDTTAEVRVKLKLDPDQVAPFNTQIEFLKKAYGLKDITDVVLRAVNEAFDSRQNSARAS